MLQLPASEEPDGLNRFPILYWNHVGLEMNRISTSLAGPQGGPTMGSRALGLLHLAMHDAFFAVIQPSPAITYLPNLNVPVPVPNGTTDLEFANAALTGAAVTMLNILYGSPGGNIPRISRTALQNELGARIADYPHPILVLEPSFAFGAQVARAIFDLLGIKTGEIGADPGPYQPRQEPYYFRDEPLNPVRVQPLDPDHPERGKHAVRIYHGPFYGSTAADVGVTDPAGHALAEPPRAPASKYINALNEVVALGGAANLASTTRDADGTVAAYYWAYDGANLIGTPPRLYNQIIRIIAWSKKVTDDPAHAGQTAEFVRIMALTNAAMTDAGKFAWREKYRYEFWRPLTGVREHGDGLGPKPAGAASQVSANASPFWQALGAPDTNTNKISFKPPFPAYPSGHATFGAAALHMTQIFYRDRAEPDPNDLQTVQPFFGRGNKPAFNAKPGAPIGFTFVSDELNGINRDLHQEYDVSEPITEQPGNVRTRVVRCFDTLQAAIFENAFSRIWLGVHWNFDAFDPADVTRHDDHSEESHTSAATPPPAGSCVPKSYKGYGDPTSLVYSHVWEGKRDTNDTRPVGGVPLGLGIANDIYCNGLCAVADAKVLAALKDKFFPTDISMAMMATAPQPEAKMSLTHIS